MIAKKIASASDAVFDILHSEGVRYIFGLPGGAAIPLFDSLVDSPIKLILTRHEQGATHMADGFARACGEPGVVLVTSGPGATNTISGLLTAHMDSVPLLVICGQQTTGNLGLDAFQEADVAGISLPVVKHSYLVRTAEDVPRIVREALHIARTGRPGPVLIDLPKDVSTSRIEVDLNQEFQLPGYVVPDVGDQATIDHAAELLSGAKKPLLLVGHGAVISGAQHAVIELAETMSIPVANTLLGKGCFPETHRLSLGMPGMHGTAYANKALIHCDLVVSIGSRWDDRITGRVDDFCVGAKKIHIDIDPAEIDKVIKVDCAILGDARQVVECLVQKVKPGNTVDWLHQIDKWKQRYPLQYPAGGGLRAQAVVEELYRLTRGDPIVVTDVGQHQMWTAQYYLVDKRYHWISSGGAGTMGFGLPASIGAQLARPDKQVVAVVGDGGFQMTMAELATAMNHKLPVKVIIVNNRYLGMVRQWQNLFHENRLSGVDLEGSPDFVALARSYGCKAFRVQAREELSKTLGQALDYSDGPCVVDAVVEKQDNVFPMIPAGAPLRDMILESFDE